MTTRWRLRALTLGLGLVLLAACASPLTAPAPSSVAEPSDAASECEPVNLVGLSGERADLTGTWHGASTTFYLRQAGGCVWWMALSDWPGQEPGAFFSHTFFGQLRPDFTLRGTWESIVQPSTGMGYGSPFGGEATFDISFKTIEGEETAVLQWAGTGFFYGQGDIVRTGPLPGSETPP